MTRPPTRKSPNGFATIYGSLVVVFLLLPIVVAAATAFNPGERSLFPPNGISLRWFASVLQSPLLIDGFVKSLVIAGASATLAAVCGTASAIALNDYVFPGRSAVHALVMLPVALPAIGLGLGILFLMPSFGLGPGLLVATLGHTVIGIPYVVAMVLSSLASFDRSLVRASLNLGVGPVRTFLQITFPHIGSGIAAGASAAFLLSLDNISISLFVTRNDTLPLRLLQRMLSYTDPSVAATSTLLLAASLAFLPLVLHAVARRRPSRRGSLGEATDII